MKSTKEKKEVYELQEDIRDLEYYSKHIWRDLFNLVKWLWHHTAVGSQQDLYLRFQTVCSYRRPDGRKYNAFRTSTDKL